MKIISNRKYNKLIKELEENKNLVLKHLETISWLENQLNDKKLNVLKNYDWAILCKDYRCDVIIEGKVISKLKGFNAEQYVGDIPTITINK